MKLIYKLPLLTSLLLCTSLFLLLALLLCIKVPSYRPTCDLDDTKKILFAHGMTAAERDIALDLLLVFDLEMSNQNISWFLYSGTLLGSWRHHGFIPWDDDVDVFLNQSHKPAVMRALSKLEPDYHLVDYNKRTKLFSRFSVKIEGYEWGWPFLDIQFFTENDTHIWDISESFAHLKYKKSDLFPLHMRPFENHWFPAPKSSLAMFKENYGELRQCILGVYNHKLEHPQRRIGVECRTLRDQVRFVHRIVVNGTMVERLKIGDWVIRSVVVEEDLNALTDPYDSSKIIAPLIRSSPKSRS